MKEHIWEEQNILHLQLPLSFPIAPDMNTEAVNVLLQLHTRSDSFFRHKAKNLYCINLRVSLTFVYFVHERMYLIEAYLLLGCSVVQFK